MKIAHIKACCSDIDCPHFLMSINKGDDDTIGWCRHPKRDSMENEVGAVEELDIILPDCPLDDSEYLY